MFTETKWTAEIAQISPNAITHTKRESTLRFLELLRTNVTGARPLSTPPLSNDLTLAGLSEKDIIEGLALEIYMDHHEESWVVAPERFFKKPASLPYISPASGLPIGDSARFPVVPVHKYKFTPRRAVGGGA